MFLETTIKRFFGKSSAPKPKLGKQLQDPATGDVATYTSNDIPIGSTLLEEDTGNIWRWNGFTWTLPPKDNEVNKELTDAINSLRLELVRLRLGMIESGACEAVSAADAEEEYAETTY